MKINGMSLAAAIGGLLLAGSMALAGPAAADAHGNAAPGEAAPAASVFHGGYATPDEAAPAAASWGGGGNAIPGEAAPAASSFHGGALAIPGEPAPAAATQGNIGTGGELPFAPVGVAQ